ncbi:MAG: hypothetical protein RLY43_1663 [Bacteroidota bacterium]
MRFLISYFILLPLVFFAQENYPSKKTDIETLVKKVNEQQVIQKKKLQNFNYSFYEKSILSAHPDSITGKIDTLFKNKKQNRYIIDSSGYKFKNLLTKQHLYLLEKASKVSVKKWNKKEEILGLKMAGLKQPIYELMGQEFIPFEWSKKHLKFLTFTIKNPLYFSENKSYLLTVDPAFTSSIKVNFLSLKQQKNNTVSGYFLLDKETFGIQKSVFILKGIINIRATTTYFCEKTQKIWLPKTQKLEVTKGVNKYNIAILGETIRFENNKNGNSEKYDYTQDLFFTLSRKYLDYTFLPSTTTQRYAIQIAKNAVTNNASFLRFFETDTIDSRVLNTYKSLDSLVTNERIEQKIYFGKKLINGQIPIGIFDIRARELLKYNNYEGFRMGLGLSTNEKLFQFFKLFGYGAYGTKDGVFKSQIGGSFRVSKNSDSWLTVSFTDDLTEFADITFLVDSKKYKLYDPRPFNISTFYNYQNYTFSYETKAIPTLETVLSLTKSKVNPLFDYTFIANGKPYKLYNLTLFNASFEWSPKSRFLQSPQQIIEVEKNYPKVIVQLTKSIPNVLENELNFTKIDLRFQQETKFISGQKTTFLWQGGMSFGNTPLSHLYSVAPNNLDKTRLIQRLTFASKTAFETMYFNEFFSDKYTFFQLKHYFNKLMLAKNCKPTLVLGSKVAFGSLSNPELHKGLVFKTMEKGFFESGLELQNIFKGFGLSAYYRYGPYQLARFEDNLAVKISFTLNLGL